jgi:hypothetical protein
LKSCFQTTPESDCPTPQEEVVDEKEKQEELGRERKRRESYVSSNEKTGRMLSKAMDCCITS